MSKSITNPVKYKTLLNALRNGANQSLADIVALFPNIREEIESNRSNPYSSTGTGSDPPRLEYEEAREIVADTVDHVGFIEVNGDMHDSIDDCADILIDLDEIEKLQSIAPSADVWWKYILHYDFHFVDHMKNHEDQVRFLENGGKPFGQ